MVIGWLRPVILLPLAMLAGLTPGQLESILAHELAHVRRHDYLMNLLQTLVETFLFYHPAVWWISRRMRLERERCCDDAAVRLSGDRIGYAEALAAVSEVRGLAPAPAATGTRGGRELIGRIGRILGVPGRNSFLACASGFNARSAVAALAVVLLVAISIALHVSTQGKASEDRAGATFNLDDAKSPPGNASIVTVIELVDKDDVPPGLYAGVPFHTSDDDPGAKWVYELAMEEHALAAEYHKAGMDRQRHNDFAMPMMPELGGRLSGVYPAKGTLEVAEQFVRDKTVTVRLRYIDEDKRIGGYPVTSVSGDKPEKSVYLFGGMPADLPPGEYTVNLELDEYVRQGDKLVLAPKTKTRHSERLSCTWTVPAKTEAKVLFDAFPSGLRGGNPDISRSTLNVVVSAPQAAPATVRAHSILRNTDHDVLVLPIKVENKSSVPVPGRARPRMGRRRMAAHESLCLGAGSRRTP